MIESTSPHFIVVINVNGYYITVTPGGTGLGLLVPEPNKFPF
jgi:hypothetical protein